MQTLEEHFNTRVNAFLATTGMRLPPADPAERARGALGRGRGRGVDPRAAGGVPGRSRRAASSGIRCGSRGRQSPMGVPRLTAVPERANDTGVRCALRRFRSAHRDRRVSAAAATSCAHAACPAGAVRAAQAVTVATPQSEGLVRVRGRVCLRTPSPRPLRVATAPAIRPGRGPGRVSSAASRRRRRCWPTGWPSGCPASPTKTGTRLFRLAFRLPARDCWPGATPGRQGRGCEYTLAAMPHQALGAGGCSGHGHSCPFGSGRPSHLAARAWKRGG